MTAPIRLLLAVLIAAAPGIGGCTHPKRWFTNRSMIRDALVQLPADGGIFIEVEQVEGLGRSERRATRYVWDQPGRARKVLDRSGDLDVIDLSPGPISSRVSADGNVAELLRDGHIVATFDYRAGTATFLP
jgi:hypothetical protein